MSEPGSDALSRLAGELQRCPYHEFLKPEAVSADPAEGLVVVRVPFRPEFRRAHDSGDVHGGIIAALIDITGHAAVAVKTGRVSPTIDLRIDYLRPAAGPELVATGRLLRAGRSIGRADVEVRDHAGAIVALGRGTFSTL
jgi:uncharacterized protein (TIGR00369 family)